jgi:hypothetical protein
MVALESVYGALHRVPVLVAFWIEGRRAAAGAALVLAVAYLADFLWDRAPDAAPPQVSAIAAGGLGLIRQHPPGPRPAPAGAGVPGCLPAQPETAGSQADRRLGQPNVGHSQLLAGPMPCYGWSWRKPGSSMIDCLPSPPNCATWQAKAYGPKALRLPNGTADKWSPCTFNSTRSSLISCHLFTKHLPAALTAAHRSSRSAIPTGRCLHPKR